MKTHSLKIALSCAALGFLAFSVSDAQGVARVWDVAGTTSTWSTSAADAGNWTPSGTWVNGTDTATFNDATGETVTLSGTVTTGGVTAVTAGNWTFQGSGIGGSYGLTKSGAGTLTLKNINTWSGNSANGNVLVSGGTLRVEGSIFDGAYANAAILTVSGGGKLELKNWTYDQGGAGGASLGGLRVNTGALIVNNGTISIYQAGTTSYERGAAIQAGGATFDVGAGVNWTIAFGATTANTYTGNPTINLTGAGTGTFDKLLNNGSGGLNKSGSGKWSLTRANTYTGNTTISGGTLNLTGSGGIYTGATKSNTNSLVISGGAILEGDRWAWGNNQSLGMLNYNPGYIAVNNGTIRNMNAANTNFENRGLNIGAGGITYENATNTTWTIVTGVNSNSYATNAGVRFDGIGNGVFNMAITGTGVSLTKNGTGTWSVTAANSYTGATTINNGKLLANNTTGSAFGTGNVTVNNNGTVGGTGAFSGALIVNSGGTISPGASIESLATGTNTWNSGGAFDFEFSTDGSTGAAGVQWDLLSITGTLNLNGIALNDPFAINLITMANATTPGLLATWNENVDHTWAGFVTTTAGISGFATNKFVIDTSGFQNTIFGTFRLVQNGNNLDLIYLTVPEPASLTLVGLGIGLVALRRRRK